MPVHPCHQKYLRFCWQDQLWQFAVLPFGLNSAPFIFTKLMKPVVATLRKLGIWVMLCLDDMLIMANSELLRQNQRSLSVCNLSPNFSWICSECREKHAVSKTTDRVFRLHFRFQCNDYFTAITEADNHVESNQTSSREDTDIIEGDIPGSGNNGSNTSGPTILQTPGEDQVILPQSWLFFRLPSKDIQSDLRCWIQEASFYNG